MRSQETKKEQPKEKPTEKDRKTGTKVIKSDQIEQDLGTGCGSKEPFGK